MNLESLDPIPTLMRINYQIADAFEDRSDHCLAPDGRAALGCSRNDGHRKRHDEPNARHDEWPDDGISHNLDRPNPSTDRGSDCFDQPLSRP